MYTGCIPTWPAFDQQRGSFFLPLDGQVSVLYYADYCRGENLVFLSERMIAQSRTNVQGATRKDGVAKSSNDMLYNIKDASIVQEPISKNYLLPLFSSGFLVVLL